jgi:flagellar motor component MotA
LPYVLRFEELIFVLPEILMLLNYFLTVLALVFSFTGTVFMLDGALSVYLDIPSILIMVLFPFVYQCLLFGISTAKNAFTAGFRKDATLEQLTKAQLFFKSYSKVIWITSLTAVLIGIVALLTYLEDHAKFGPSLALVFLSILYGGLIHLVIIIPNSVFLKKRLLEINMDI